MDLSKFTLDELASLYWDFNGIFYDIREGATPEEYDTLESIRDAISEKLIELGYTDHIEPDDPPCYYDSPQWAHDNDYPDNINYGLDEEGYWR